MDSILHTPLQPQLTIFFPYSSIHMMSIFPSFSHTLLSLWSLASCLCLLSCSVVSDSVTPMDCGLSGSSVHGIFQARILEWVAISFGRGSSRPMDWTCVFCIFCLLYPCATWETPVVGYCACKLSLFFFSDQFSFIPQVLPCLFLSPWRLSWLSRRHQVFLLRAFGISFHYSHYFL